MIDQEKMRKLEEQQKIYLAQSIQAQAQYEAITAKIKAMWLSHFKERLGETDG